MPTKPQFRESNGSLDWRQLADLFIPGNVWDSRSNQWRPRGIASGVVQAFTGPLTGRLADYAIEHTSVPRMPSFNNAQPSGFVGPPAPYSSPYAGVPANQWGPRDLNQENSEAMQRVAQTARGAQGHSGTADFLGRGSSSALSGTARGAMADETFGSQMALMDYMAAMRNRNGAQIER